MTTSSIDRTSATSPERAEQRRTLAPAVDIFENKDEFLLFADLPGVTRDALTMHFEKGQLQLEARRASAIVSQDGARAEYDYKRAFAVPHGIDTSRIEAELNAGVLRVRLPKSDALKPRRIEVKAG